MTVPTEQSDQAYVGNGFEDSFGTVFPYLLASHLRVRFTPIATGIERLLVLGVDYVVPDNAEPSDANLITAFIPDIGDLLVIEHSIPFTQPVSFRTQGEFSPTTHEEALDAAAIRDQELLRRVKALETVGGAGSVAAGAGLSFSGQTLNVGSGPGIIVNPDTIQAAFGLVGEMSAISRAGAFEGNVNKAAKIDHRHDINVASAVEITDATNSTGNAQQLAAANHQHAHGNRGGGSLHANATGGTAGFMSAADKLKLDAMAGTSFGSIVDVTKAAGSNGVATTAARSDHKHDITTAVTSVGAVQIGNAAAEGSSTALARADHIHTVAAGVPGPVTGLQTASAGVATTFARSDHVHEVYVNTPVSITDNVNANGTDFAMVTSDHKHAHGNRGGGTLHAAANPTTAGFQSNVDKNKEDLLVLGAKQTTNASPTPIDFNDLHTPTGSLTPDIWITNSNEELAVTFEVVVTARKIGTGDAANWGMAALVTRTVGGGPTIINSSTLYHFNSGGAAAWSIALGFSSGGTVATFVVTVTGAAATTIQWTAAVRQLPARATSTAYLP